MLYDQPYEDRERSGWPARSPSRVCCRTVRLVTMASRPSAEAAIEQDTTTNFEQMLLDNLQKAGVQNGRKAERFEFAEIERVPGQRS